MRRLFWGSIGIGLGAVVGGRVVRWGERTKQRYSPPNLAREAAGGALAVAQRFRTAVADGIAEMAEREPEIRAGLGLPRS